MDPCNPYNEVKGRFIGYLSLFAIHPDSKQMTTDQFQQLCWTCLSTWSCFATLSTELHSLLDLWQAQDAWHQGQVANPQYDQSRDVSEMFANFFQAANATGAFDRLNSKIAEDTRAHSSMEADLKALNEALAVLPAPMDSLSQQAEAFRIALESPKLSDEHRAYFNFFRAQVQAELQAAETNHQQITAMIAQRYPTYMAKFAGISSLHKFGNELMRSFSFFRTDNGAPSKTNAMYQDYIARYNAIREQPVGLNELSGCVNQYNVLNDYAEWSILLMKGQTDAFEVWRSQKLSGQTPTPIVVAGDVSPSVRTVVEAANTAMNASGNADVAAAIASISPSPSRAPSASGSPQTTPVAAAHSAMSIARPSLSSSSRSSSSSESSLGSVAASVSSARSDDVATPLGPFTASVPPHGGGKKKTRSNHKRSAHKHKRSAHKHKRSAHKHKRSAHKRSAHKHKKL